MEKSDSSIKGLINIGVIRGNYWVYSLSERSSAEEQLWIVLKDYIDEHGYRGYRLTEGTIIKMGRCRYEVKKLVKNESDNKSFDNTYVEPQANNPQPSIGNDSPTGKMTEPHNAEEVSQILDTPKIPEEPTCRICLTSDNNAGNLLIKSPCLCTGSVRFIHEDCLKHWLRSKITEKRSDYSITYTWKDFECEVCKTKYPGRNF